jgi:hypothetical protein
MESDGLTIDGKEFQTLTVKKQNIVMYQNQVETIRLVKQYSLHQKIQYILVTAALAGVGILFKIRLGV